MKRIVLFSLLFFTQVAFSQTALKQKIKTIDTLLNTVQGGKAVLVLDSLLHLSVEKKDWEMGAVCMNARVDNLGIKSREVQSFLNSELALLVLKNLKINHPTRASLLIKEAYHFGRLKNYTAALTNYEEALVIFNNLNIVNDQVIYAYRKAGENALRFLDYEKADAYYQNVLRIDTSKSKYADAYAALAKSCNYKREFSQAIQYFKKGVQFGVTAKDKFRNNCEGAIAFASWGKPVEAKKLLGVNFELLENEGTAFEKKYNKHYYYNEAEVYIALGELDLAKKSLETSIEIIIKNNKRTESRVLAKHYVELGDLLSSQSNYSEALSAFHKGMMQVFPKFNNPDLLSNPSPEEVQREPFMMTTAKRKAKMFLKLYEQDENIKWLKSAEACFNIAFSSANNLHSTFTDDDAKFYLEHFNANTLQNAIYCHYLLAEKENKSDHINKAYHLSEQHKSLVLREAILKSKALSLSGVPDSLIEKEQNLKEQVLQLKQKIKTTESATSAEATKEFDYLKTQLSIYQNQYSFLLSQLKKSYPNFAKSIEAKSHLDLKTIQSKLLNEQTALLQYQWGEVYVFVFQIKKNKIELRLLPRKELDEKLSVFLNILSDRGAQEANPNSYFESAYSLYQQLIEPTITSLGNKINKLIVVPDGPISYVPFEALIEKNWTGSFAQAPYLINQYNFQYAYSPSLILQELRDKERLNGILAIAPIFKKQQRGLPTLSQSESEINSIAMPGLTRLQGSKANLPAFRKELKNKQILHLSTHAQANSGKLPPRIEFADTSLFLPSLYSMQIPADLVILSTCESNLGAYATGEGVMSLSRGFAYAGAESMIASLWAVNENSTTQLFTQYYQQLKIHSKANALHEAKLTYLQQSSTKDRFKAPYYWAGFIFTGKDGRIEMKSPFWGRTMFALIGVLVLGLLFFTTLKNR